MTADTPATADAIWADGALRTADAVKFLATTRTAFFEVAKERNWPRRYRGLSALWPRRLLAEYLANLPAEKRKGSAKA
jgi:cyclopropane fatty-acyl-phospholipid synthase-like methyltransferase